MPQDTMKKVFITGANSGIGAHLSLLLAERGYEVLAGVREGSLLPDALKDHANIKKVRLDLDSDQGIENGFQQIAGECAVSGLFALINNAGFALPGPMTHLDMDQLRAQFQVNLFAPVKLSQLCFDLLLKYGPGSRIINISSVSGLFASPFMGAYAGSKFALEGISDSMRRELFGMGIHVVLIEPGPLKTSIWKKNLGLEHKYRNTPYAQILHNADERILATESKALPLEHLDRPILDALESKKPKARYFIHASKWLFLLISQILPVHLADRLIHRHLNTNSTKIRPI